MQCYKNLLYHFCSYIEKNIRSSDLYRSYSNGLPKWLHNKPKPYVQHCIKKIEAASNISQDAITQKGVSRFDVRSEHGDSIYNIDFGNDTDLPSCSCYSWRKTFLPCKHMLSVINHIELVTWDSFGTIYRDSVFFTLDFEVFGMTPKVWFNRNCFQF